MKKILILNCLILSISCFSQSSERNSHKILKTDLIDENLKGTVKSYNLTVKYLDLQNKNNNGNRIATPKGGSENVFVEYNKYGLMTSSLLGNFNDDSLELEPMESKNLVQYKYNEHDLIYKSKFTTLHDYPPMLTQQFYHIFPNRSDYYNYDPKYPTVTKGVYAMNYDEDKNTLTDVVFFRKHHHNNNLKVNDKEVTNDENIQNKWHYEYNSLGLLKKIKIEKINLGYIIKYLKNQIKSYKLEIVFEYDKQNRLTKYSVFDIDKKEEIGSVVYSYKPKYGYVESETIYQKYSGEYYLSNVHYRTLKYNKQGDLIANLLQVEPKDEQLVRIKQLYLDKFYEYSYDENDNWTECKIRVNNSTSEISAIMNRKIEYFKE